MSFFHKKQAQKTTILNMFFKNLLFCLALLFLIVLNPSIGQTDTNSNAQKGFNAYQDFEFQAAIKHFQKALQTSQLSKSQKARILSHIAVCHYNQGKLDNARKAWIKAQIINPYIKIPSGQAPSVQKFFKKYKRKVPPKPRKRAEQPKPRKRVEQPKPRKRVEQPKPRKRVEQPKPRKRVEQPKPRKRVEQPKPRIKVEQPNKRIEKESQIEKFSPSQLPTSQCPSYFSRHAISTLLFSLGLASAGTAGFFTYETQKQLDQMYETKGKNKHLEEARADLFIANILWGSGGGLAGLSFVAFLLEPSACSSVNTTSNQKEQKRSTFHFVRTNILLRE